MTACAKCDSEVLDDQTSCPSCGNALKPQTAAIFCEGCGGKIDSRNAPCPKCGHTKNSGMPTQYKSEGTTMVLSIVLGLLGLQGIGHLYLGRVGRGVGLLVGSIILYYAGWTLVSFGAAFIILPALLPLLIGGIVLLVVSLAIFIWQILDARKLCKVYNERVGAGGSPPW